jgi:hypothetical protein
MMNKSISLMAVALAVLVLLDVAAGAVVPVPPGTAVVAGLAAPLVTGAAVPLAAVPEPLTVAAFTVVEPVAFTLPEPLLLASTTVEPEAVVPVVVGLGVVIAGFVAALPVTGAVVPLAAVPEPLRVAALTVVVPLAFAAPEPLLIALTVLDPIAVVVCARAGLLRARPSKPMLTAVAIVLLGCGVFDIRDLLSDSP